VLCSLKNRMTSAELNSQLGIECITDVVRRNRLRWFGYVERKDSDDWVSAYRSFKVNGVKDRGGSRRTWVECIRRTWLNLFSRLGFGSSYVEGSNIQKPSNRASMDSGR